MFCLEIKFDLNASLNPQFHFVVRVMFLKVAYALRILRFKLERVLYCH